MYQIFFVINSIYYIDVNSNHQNKKIAVMENQHGEELIRLDIFTRIIIKLKKLLTNIRK